MLVQLDAPKTWLLAGAGFEFAINAWALGFVIRMRACDRGQGRLRAALMVVQSVVLLLLVAFATVLVFFAGLPRTVASWIATAFFSAGLVASATMRTYIHNIPFSAVARSPKGRRPTCVTLAEFVAVDAVNWVAIVGVAVKVLGLIVSLWLALVRTA